MAENINLRAVNETPVVEAVSDGDKALLIDANGMAKQIPANKLGGSGGGGGIIYTEITMSDGTTDNTARLYADVARSQMLTYEEAKEMFKSGAIICVPENGMDIFVTPLMVVPVEEMKFFQVFMLIEQAITFGAFCSDSIV